MGFLGKKKKEEEQEVFMIREQDIALGLRAIDKTDAIEQVADFLIKNKRVSKEYKEGMLKREEEVSTYLMNGISIPHGIGASKKYIKESGIFIGQFKDGVTWNENGDIVYLVVALASNSDVHMSVLTRLTMLLENESEVKQLIETDDIHVILEAFSSDIEQEIRSKEETVKMEGVHQSILFIGENGMHARPASFLAKLAQSYESTTILLHVNNNSAKATSIPSILKLNITFQTEVTVSAQGVHATEAVEKIIAYIADELNHEKAEGFDKTAENIYDPVPLKEILSLGMK